MKRRRIIDVDEANAALKVAAYLAVHGTREDKQGRFWGSERQMKKTRWVGEHGNVVISCGKFFRAVRSGHSK